MTNFNWIKGLGYGVIIWLVMFGFASAIVAYWAPLGTGFGIVLAILGGVLAYLFAANVKPVDIMQSLGYGALWVAVGIVLDILVSQQFVSGLFSTWTYYLGYALVLLAPITQISLSGESTSAKSI